MKIIKSKKFVINNEKVAILKPLNGFFGYICLIGSENVSQVFGTDYAR